MSSIFQKSCRNINLSNLLKFKSERAQTFEIAPRLGNNVNRVLNPPVSSFLHIETLACMMQKLENRLLQNIVISKHFLAVPLFRTWEK